MRFHIMVTKRDGTILCDRVTVDEDAEASAAQLRTRAIQSASWKHGVPTRRIRAVAGGK